PERLPSPVGHDHAWLAGPRARARWSSDFSNGRYGVSGRAVIAAASGRLALDMERGVEGEQLVDRRPLDPIDVAGGRGDPGSGITAGRGADPSLAESVCE